MQVLSLSLAPDSEGIPAVFGKLMRSCLKTDNEASGQESYASTSNRE